MDPDLLISSKKKKTKMAAFSWFTEACYLQSLRAKRAKGEQSFFYIINKFASKSVFLLSALKAAAKW